MAEKNIVDNGWKDSNNLQKGNIQLISHLY